MARRRRRKRQKVRGAYPSARSLTVRLPRSLLPAVEDRRTYHPLRRNRPTMRTDARRTERLVLAPLEKSPRARSVHEYLAFKTPEKVVTCVRRKTRREVLFANGGASKKRKRKPRRNWRSNIRC